MDPIRLKITAAALGAAALVATVAIVDGGRGQAPAQAALEAPEAALVERVTAALATPEVSPSEAREIVARIQPGGAAETAAAIASATRVALASIAEAPDAAAQADASGFRQVDDAAAPAFVISAADAWIAADQGWVAASGVAPATIELRPRPRSD